jgi:hypothetical protein
LPGDSWTRYFWTYYFELGMWINFQSLIVVPPCCAYPEISTLWIKVKTLMIQATPCGYCVSYCRFVDDGALTSATFKLEHTSINWILPWGIETWFSLETKGFRSRQIEWLVWRFTTMIARHYMHMAKMKKHRFIKNKVMEHIVKMNIKKSMLILHTHVTHGIDDSNETSRAWMVWSQHHPNMTYKVPFPVTRYVCCTYEWTLCGNVCKHQIVVLVTCIDLIKK